MAIRRSDLTELHVLQSSELQGRCFQGPADPLQQFISNKPPSSSGIDSLKQSGSCSFAFPNLQRWMPLKAEDQGDLRVTQELIEWWKHLLWLFYVIKKSMKRKNCTFWSWIVLFNVINRRKQEYLRKPEVFRFISVDSSVFCSVLSPWVCLQAK